MPGPHELGQCDTADPRQTILDFAQPAYVHSAQSVLPAHYRLRIHTTGGIAMNLLRTARGRIFLLSFLLLTCAFASSAQKRNWVYLGSAHVDGGADHDTIRVNGGDGPFRAIRFKVSGVSVKFDHVVVRFGNGQQQQLAANFVVAGNTSSPAIDLPGTFRNIETVDMWYERGNWGHHNPKVSVYGLR
jgi:hypothetical protein